MTNSNGSGVTAAKPASHKIPRLLLSTVYIGVGLICRSKQEKALQTVTLPSPTSQSLLTLVGVVWASKVVFLLLWALLRQIVPNTSPVVGKKPTVIAREADVHGRTKHITLSLSLGLLSVIGALVCFAMLVACSYSWTTFLVATKDAYFAPVFVLGFYVLLYTFALLVLRLPPPSLSECFVLTLSGVAVLVLCPLTQQVEDKTLALGVGSTVVAAVFQVFVFRRYFNCHHLDDEHCSSPSIGTATVNALHYLGLVGLVCALLVGPCLLYKPALLESLSLRFVARVCALDGFVHLCGLSALFLSSPQFVGLVGSVSAVISAVLLSDWASLGRQAAVPAVKDFPVVVLDVFTGRGSFPMVAAVLVCVAGALSLLAVCTCLFHRPLKIKKEDAIKLQQDIDGIVTTAATLTAERGAVAQAMAAAQTDIARLQAATSVLRVELTSCLADSSAPSEDLIRRTEQHKAAMAAAMATSRQVADTVSTYAAEVHHIDTLLQACASVVRA